MKIRSTKPTPIADVFGSHHLQQVRDLPGRGEHLTERAKRIPEFANATGASGDAGEKSAGAASAIDKLMKKGTNAGGDVSAARVISGAINVLYHWALPE